MADQVVFLHLSDIHFQSWSGSIYDEDAILRQTLVLDAAKVKDQLGAPDGILVTGDIAFKAGAGEYDIAKKWLIKLCEKLDVTFAKVWCVPGNHDIDQAVIESSTALKLSHQDLRSVNPKVLSSRIRGHLCDPSGCSILKPLAGYNEFAAALNCQVTPDRPKWTKDFVLNDTSILRLWGLNSTIVSDHEDNDFKKVVLGDYQLPIPDDGVVNLAMSHHPPSWWRDPDSVAASLVAHCRVQLYGHKHIQQIQRIENSLVLSAGAVQPDKREPDWEPTYNWLGLSVSGTGSDRVLTVRTYPRVWEKSKSVFVPDSNACNGKDHRTESLALDAWKPVAEASESAKSIQGDKAPAVEQSATPEPATEKEINQMEPARILTYRFFDLPHVKRIDIACELELYMDEDEGLQDFELFGRILQRAIQRNKVAQLWNSVELGHGDGKHESNPFEKNPD